MKEGIGVCVGRWQSPDLHQGHTELIDEVYKHHDIVIIFVGLRGIDIPNRKNPFDFLVREKMLREKYPNAIIFSIQNEREDSDWSKELDRLIGQVKGTHKVTLYGSRDSFIKGYNGRYKESYIHVHTTGTYNATAIRNDIVKEVRCNEDYRAGIITGVSQALKYDQPSICVDIAMINRTNNTILLGKKSKEKLFRFIGGYVDSKDNSITDAAKRELREEAGNLEYKNLRILGEAKIDDWRNFDSDQKIFSILYTCDYVSGNENPDDDIVYLEWVKLSSLTSDMINIEHRILLNLLNNDN